MKIVISLKSDTVTVDANSDDLVYKIFDETKMVNLSYNGICLDPLNKLSHYFTPDDLTKEINLETFDSEQFTSIEFAEMVQAID